MYDILLLLNAMHLVKKHQQILSRLGRKEAAPVQSVLGYEPIVLLDRDLPKGRQINL
jgi:hypothetical protein